MNEKEDYLIQIRDKLRKDGIKLWLSPYYDQQSSKTSETDVQQLSEDFSKVLNIPCATCKEIILELQENAIENLKQKMEFEKSGKATLKIKLLRLNTPAKIVNKEVLLSMRALDLKELLSKDINVSCDRFKLISSGKVLIDGESLGCQSVKNGQNLLAIAVNESPTEITEQENQIKELEGVKTDSRLLALDTHYMHIEDQFGNPVKIPNHEKKALTVAMALQQKGKNALQKEDYSKALIYYLEADIEYKNINSTLLNSVDNYALLDLDIAWCYLCLQSFNHLPEAYARLKRCEEKFHSTYGNNMERLIAVKGTAANEAALFMRLHLLQAIVMYHQNNRDEALRLLKQVESELNCLKVDESSVLTLVELGYSIGEAKLGLRATKGDINQAANFINEQREKRQQARKKAMAEEILERERKKLGKCEDGKQYVDPNFVKILVNMGYNREMARRALQKSNNIISDSIQYMQENPLPGPSESKSQEFKSYIEELTKELTEAGFDPRMATLALQKHTGDIMKAAEELIANNGLIDGDLTELNIAAKSLEEIVQKQEQKKQAFERLREDLGTENEEMADVDLSKEEAFLSHYLGLLNKD